VHNTSQKLGRQDTMDFFTNVFQSQTNRSSRRQERQRTPPTPAGSHPIRQMSASLFERAGEAAAAHMDAAGAYAAAAASSVQEEVQQQGATPSASRKAIRQLPTIKVSSEDLVDENNRECCICFDE